MSTFIKGFGNIQEDETICIVCTGHLDNMPPCCIVLMWKSHLFAEDNIIQHKVTSSRLNMTY